MSNIDKLITQAHLMEVKVLDFSAILEEMDHDIFQLHQMAEKYNTKIEKPDLERKFQQLRSLASDWVNAVDLKSHRNNKIVIFIEEDQD